MLKKVGESKIRSFWFPRGIINMLLRLCCCGLFCFALFFCLLLCYLESYFPNWGSNLCLLNEVQRLIHWTIREIPLSFILESGSDLFLKKLKILNARRIKLFQVKMLWMATLNMPANMKNSAVATGLEKVSFHSSLKERQCQRMFNYTIALISHASKVMLKILQALTWTVCELRISRCSRWI